MRTYRKNFPIRLIIAGTLILASFLSAFFLSAAANRTELFWSAKTSLIPGSVLSATDLVPERAAFLRHEPSYLLASQNVSGYTVTRLVKAGEFIPLSAIVPSSKSSQSSSVPISLRGADLPSGTQVGDLVDIYQVGDPKISVDAGPPVLVLTSVYILAIDSKGQNMGGEISLTISVPAKNVLGLIDATSSGRLVVVKVHV